MKEPKVQVGILSEPQIEFILLNSYHIKGKEIAGRQVVTYVEDVYKRQGHSCPADERLQIRRPDFG